MELTPELEEAVTETLFTLRNLRMQELGLGQKSRRYAVGFREVRRGRMSVQGALGRFKQCLPEYDALGRASV